MKIEVSQELLFWLIAITIVILSMYVSFALDNYEKEKANIRCGGADNVVIRYTIQGDKYYQCKVEK